MFSRSLSSTVSRFRLVPLDSRKLAKKGLILQKYGIIHQNSFSSFSRDQAAMESNYEQIPEYLKIHMFTPELEILRYDELRGPFKDFLSEYILNHLEKRANEVRLERENSNPESRLNNDNVVRFMKVLSRLKQLFGLNGGNTEVLDAVLHSQFALNAFEAKLAAKKQANQAKTRVLEPKTDLYAPGPYLQIPESLGIHDFAEELKLFKDYELKKDFREVLASELLDLMEKRLKQVYNEKREFKNGNGVNRKSLVRFYNLFPKLRKLLAWNGGATFVLDTLLDSQKVFELVDAKIYAKIKEKSKEHVSYRQLPEDMLLEEYGEELEELRLKFKTPFSTVSSRQILQSVTELAELNSNSEKGLIFLKLYRNLAILFKQNNDQTFVLDSVLVNRSVFKSFESRLNSRLSSSETLEKTTEYRGTDHVISLLNNLNGSEDIRAGLLKEEERTFQSALAQAMSKEEKDLYEKDPEEYKEISNLTSDKIRGTYHHRSDAGRSLRQVQKDEIEKYLKKSKAKKDIAEENNWREQKAFEWSNSLYKNRSFKTHNFFDPIMGKSSKFTKFPMFPGTGDESEYLILTSTGQQFSSPQNPLGMNHVPEDMFAIFQTLQEDELAKFLKNVEKLRKKGWRLIGAGRTKGMLVLSRETRNLGWKIGKALKGFVASCVLCFISLISVNWLMEEKGITGIEQGPENGLGESTEIRFADAKNSLEEQQPKKRFWLRLFWN